MSDRHLITRIGRFRAAYFFALFAFVVVGLTGCGTTNTPLWATAKALIPGWHGDVSEQAKKIPYATIDLTYGRRGGLLVLAEKKGGLTFWETGRKEVVVLNHSDLQAMEGLLPRLEINAQTMANGDPVNLIALGTDAQFTVVRAWRDKKGSRHSGQAQARWHCASETSSVELPLTTIDLQKCVKSLRWSDGSQTQSAYWRDAQGQIWKAAVAAWPGAPQVSWQVARPWWPQH